MARRLLSENLADLYDMQQLVEQQTQQGMRLVAFAVEAQDLTGKELHFFRDLRDLAARLFDAAVPANGELMNISDFKQVLDQVTARKEQELERPLEQFIQQISSEQPLSPQAQERYFARVFQQDLQQQLEHDLGNIYTHLLSEQQQGKAWVAYPDIEKVGKEDLRVFDTREAARAYVLDKSMVAVVYDFQPIDRLLGALEPLVQQKIDRAFGQEPGEPGDPRPDINKPPKGKDKGQDEELER